MAFPEIVAQGHWLAARQALGRQEAGEEPKGRAVGPSDPLPLDRPLDEERAR
ncbi:MAG: hypothetical protein ACREQM_12140 [Candidatus Dormibacteraceae bacterium]